MQFMFQHLARMIEQYAAAGTDAAAVPFSIAGRIVYYGYQNFLPYLSAEGQALVYAILALF